MTDPSPHRKEARRRLREVGLRCTRPRLDVLSHLLAGAEPMSHADLWRLLRREGYDRATVYRNLVDMTDAGLLRRSDLGDHVWRFEIRGVERHAAGGHAHFLCDECGAVTCLDDADLQVDRLVDGLVREVVLKGTCGHCR
ncbi:MAG: Fur family transcriptional regulator [Myxococcota bacterium]